MNFYTLRNIISLLLIIAFLSSCGNLNNNEIAKVDHRFSGCFASGHNKITLLNKAGITFAKLETDGKGIRETKISKEQLDAFYSFISNLKALKQEQGCTTVEDYIVYTKKETIKKTDGGCEWNGFEKLIANLFTKSP